MVVWNAHGMIRSIRKLQRVVNLRNKDEQMAEPESQTLETKLPANRSEQGIEGRQMAAKRVSCIAPIYQNPPLDTLAP